MAYCKHSDLIKWIEENALVQLASQSDQATIMSDPVIAVLDEMIASADSLIDSYCLNRWPDLRTEDPVPDLINQISAQIAIYYMFQRRQAISEDRRLAYEDCLKHLKLFADGKVSLGLDTSGNKAAAGTDSFQTDASSDYTVPSDDQRVFTEDKLDNF